MNYTKTIKLLLALFIASGATAAIAEDDLEVNLTKPPASIGEWYKPSNKRQVGLHPRFRLRPEMAAIRE